MDNCTKLVKESRANFYQKDAMKSAYVNIGKMKSMLILCLTIVSHCKKQHTIISSFFHSTFKFSCHGFNKEDADAYVAENILEKKLDKFLNEEDHLPIERCHGVAITGK